MTDETADAETETIARAAGIGTAGEKRGRENVEGRRRRKARADEDGAPGRDRNAPAGGIGARHGAGDAGDGDLAIDVAVARAAGLGEAAGEDAGRTRRIHVAHAGDDDALRLCAVGGADIAIEIDVATA